MAQNGKANVFGDFVNFCPLASTFIFLCRGGFVGRLHLTFGYGSRYYKMQRFRLPSNYEDKRIGTKHFYFYSVKGLCCKRVERLFCGFPKLYSQALEAL